MPSFVEAFHSGAILVELWAIGLFFFRFWRRTRDPLLISFAMAFWVLAIERLVPRLVRVDEEHSLYVYSLRLLAFALISAAIIYKNRPISRRISQVDSPEQNAPPARWN